MSGFIILRIINKITETFKNQVSVYLLLLIIETFQKVQKMLDGSICIKFSHIKFYCASTKCEFRIFVTELNTGVDVLYFLAFWDGTTVESNR